MPIIGIVGGISQGKTLVMTAMLLREHRLYNRPLITNYHLKQVPYTYVTFEHMLAIAKQGINLQNVALGLDEIHMWMDPRMSGTSKETRLLTYFINQSGKDDINIYHTTQSRDQVEKRLNNRTDIWVYVKKQGDLHLCVVDDQTQPQLGLQKMVIRGDFIHQFYNTREKVKPPEMK